jgi:hypothetical protein
MARFEVTGPDGARYQVEGPEGTTEQDAIAQVQKQIAAQPAPSQRSPAQAADAPDKYTTGNPMGDQGGQGGSAMPEAPGISVRYLREQMAPEPGWVRSGVLPIATKEVSPGQGAASQGWKFDAVGPISSLLGPALDLLEGTGLETSVGGPNAPLAGKVSPEASMLLLGSRLGNPVQQFRNPLMPPGRDIRFGQPTMAEVGPVLRREAPLSQEFQQAPIAPGAAQKIAETPQGAPVSGEPVQAPALSAQSPSPTFLDSSWMKKAGDAGGGAYDMGKGGAALADAAQQALDSGATVQLIADGGAKIVDITQVKNGMLYDAKGQPWGSMSIATDGTGREGLRITGGGDTRPVGAQATPHGQSGLTAEEAADYGSTADKQWLYKSMPPGEANTVEYIKGITPTMAQRELTAVRARETKDLRNLSPEAAQAEREVMSEHNEKRKADFQENAGSDVTQGIEERAAKKAIDDELAAAHSHGGTVDATPVIDIINEERNAPSGKLPPVQTALDQIEKALQKRDGSGLETDPRQVHGARRVITLMQSKQWKAEHPAYGDMDVQAALIRVRDAIDASIEPASPGFKKAITNYSEAQRKIEAREVMQEAEAGLYDDQGRMQFHPLHAFMKKAIQSRDPRMPPNPYKSLTEAQMNRLKALHDDLMRVANAEDLAKAFGSDTAQNAAGFARRAMQGATSTLAGSAVGLGVTSMFGPVVGTIAGGTTTAATQRLFSRQAQRRAAMDMNKLLRPDPTRYPTQPNPFNEPPGP